MASPAHRFPFLVAATLASILLVTPSVAETSTAGEGYYLNPARGPAPFAPEYERWFGEKRRPVRYGRAAIELAGLLAIGTSYYWIASDPNKQDWDYIDLRDRSLHVEVKFDNNMFSTNFLLHPGAGLLSYAFTRGNGIDIPRSAGAALLSSFIFEFLLEWLEKPSVNDLIATPLGGIAAGEFFFHLGDYLSSAYGHDNTAQRVFAYTLGAPVGINTGMDGAEAPSGPRDALGYSAAYWHKFGLGYGIAEVANDRGDHGILQDLFIEARLIGMPGFLQPGRFSVDFQQGNFTEARLRVSMSGGRLEDLDLWFGSDLVGHYRQNYVGSPNALVGSGAMIAASVDMRYYDRLLLGRRDQFAAFHFLGPSGKVWFGLGHGLMARAEGGFHLDFAGVMSPAYRDFVATLGAAGTKTVLQLQDYYQGVGASGRAAASLGLFGVELGGYARYGAYRSVDGLDCFTTPLDVGNTDQLIELGMALQFTPPDAPLTLRMVWEGLEHRSQMGPYSRTLLDYRVAGAGIVSF